jgi:hypothetical protein
VAKKAKKATEKAKREPAKATRKVIQKKEEEAKIKNREEPLSAAEARRRGLKFYRGTRCNYGHDSLRDLKSNCLRCRELEKLKKASINRSR